MATASDIVSRALRLLTVLDPHEAAEAEDFETGTLALNAMCARWEANGMAIGWSPIVNPADDLPCPPEVEEALAYNLAVRLRPEYNVQLAQDVIEIAKEGMRALMRDRLVEMPLRMRNRLSNRLSNGDRWNIVTDSPF